MNPAFDLIESNLRHLTVTGYFFMFGGFLFWPLYLLFFKSSRRKIRFLGIIFFVHLILYVFVVSSLYNDAKANLTDWGDGIFFLPLIAGLSILASIIVLILVRERTTKNQ